MLSDLSISADLTTQWRYLGIYEVPVYTTVVQIKGRIERDKINDLQAEGDLLLWLPLGDLRGVDHPVGFFVEEAVERNHVSLVKHLIHVRAALDVVLVGEGSIEVRIIRDHLQGDIRIILYSFSKKS